MLLTISEDVVFAEILVFRNVFGFPAVNWAPKRTETIKFSCIPFEPKFKIFKDFLNTVIFLLETGQNVSKIKQYLEKLGPEKSPKGAISWILNQYKKLGVQNLAEINAKSWGVSHGVYKSINKKTLKMSQKINFLAQFRPFLNTSKNCSITDASSCLSSLVKILGCFWEFWPKIRPKTE